MLEKQYRLKKNKEFKYVFNRGGKVYCKFMGLFYVKTKFRPYRVGFSISNKIGNSVVRHKIKRRMAHAMRELKSIVNPNYNYVILARPEVVELDYNGIKSNLQFLFNKLKGGGPAQATAPAPVGRRPSAEGN